MTHQHADDIAEIRKRICHVFLITFAVIAIPAGIASMLRAADIGWQPVMSVHALLVTSSWLMVVFRKRIPYQYLAAFIVAVFVVIGVGGIYQFGISAAGTVFLVAASPIATLLLGLRSGIITLLVMVVSAGILAWLTLTGAVQSQVDIVQFVRAPSSWISAILGWSLAAVAMTASLHVFNKKLINALLEARRSREELLKHQATLEKAIKDREAANRQLQSALDEIKTLRGILPICSYCRAVRDDEGAWSQLETYVANHSEAQFSHGICPECLRKARIEAGLDPEK